MHDTVNSATHKFYLSDKYIYNHTTKTTDKRHDMYDNMYHRFEAIDAVAVPFNNARRSLILASGLVFEMER